MSFGPGEFSKPFTVQVVGDLTTEVDETILVNVTASTAGISDGQGIGTILEDERNGAFACRASAVRLIATEPAVANRPNAPCLDETKTLGTTSLASGLVRVVTTTASAATDQTPTVLESTAPATSDNAVSNVRLERTTVTVLGLLSITATAVQAEARVGCGAGPGGLTPTFTSSSTTGSLTINGVAVSLLGNATVQLPLGLGSLQLNRIVTTPTSLTRQGVRLQVLGLEIVLAEAKVGITGNPCAQ